MEQERRMIDVSLSMEQLGDKIVTDWNRFCQIWPISLSRSSVKTIS